MTNRKGGNERGKGRDGGERYLLKYFFSASIVYFPSTLPLDPEGFQR